VKPYTIQNVWQSGSAVEQVEDPLLTPVCNIPQADPTNANVYIGSISPDVSDAELEAVLKPYGVLLELRIFRNNCFAFAQYENHNDAVQAIVGG
jgi:RNA recognition motif-containing protein